MYLYRCRCPAPRFPHIRPLSPGILAQLQVLGISKALCAVQTVGYLQDLWHKKQRRHLYFFLESSREGYGHSTKCLSISRCIRAMQLSSTGDQMSPGKPSLGNTPVTSFHTLHLPFHSWNLSWILCRELSVG